MNYSELLQIEKFEHRKGWNFNVFIKTTCIASQFNNTISTLSYSDTPALFLLLKTSHFTKKIILLFKQNLNKN